jgi:uncharacterized protein YbaP (TraB family)
MQTNRFVARGSKIVAIVLAVACLAQLEAAPARNFIWKATGKQGAIYLVGSVHLLTKDFYPLSPALETAYKSSDLLVEEVDMGEMLAPGAQMQLLSRGLLSGNQSLDKVLTPATYALLAKKLGEVGAPVEALKRMKPWMIALTLEALQWQKAGFDSDLGLDKHFYDQARQDGKEVMGLETVDYQISRFDEMSMELQDHLLAETIKGIDTEQSNMTKLIESWRLGDAPAVERIVLKDLQQETQLYQRLLVERNKNWMPKLEALFSRKRPAFVVVGAAHLVGPDGLLTMLKAKGYTLEQQ